ncbi:MAG: DUF3810 domain-containing protein [Desulfitobacteriaceae bacterium]|nr:DUF3810 domain-containing protein [Desulfitobacteriaceae bacterium]MDD4754313.1 DUF3810 domain-containing protein [Desulfitobacteriaceae bacterium]
MVWVKRNRKILLILLIPAGILLTKIAAYFPQGVEIIYARGFFPIIGRSLSKINGVFPFSLGEISVVILIVYWATSMIRALYGAVLHKARKRTSLAGWLVNFLAFAGVVYFIFILVWGLNYYRLPFSEIAQLTLKPASEKELAQVCEKLIDNANNLRVAVKEENGVMKVSGTKPTLPKRAQAGYVNAAKTIPQLGGEYSPAKKVFLSETLSYTGISGIYFPFTGEANFNGAMPDVMLPNTICHEMAHQRGFAREDEANYIAFLTCRDHPDIDFQYSGTVLALNYALRALRTSDNEAVEHLIVKYSPGLKRDLEDIVQFWSKYQGPVERLSYDINNLYLKSNQQKDGVASYGRMVDLLIADYRKNNHWQRD